MHGFGAALSVFVLISGAAFATDEGGRFDRTLNVSGPADLDVMTDSGGISVRQGAGGSVQIHAILKANHGSWLWAGDVESRIRALEKNPPIQQNGNSIRVGHVTDSSLLRGVSMRLEILTPADTKLRAAADSGGIRVEGINGPVECKTDSGGIEIYNISSEVRATADSGGIRIHNVQGRVFARADSGGIHALDVGGPVDVKTDSGGIEIVQTKPASVRAGADSGGAKVKLASGGGYDIVANSESGGITVPEMTVRGTVSHHHAEGKLRGGGPTVDVHVDSGNIHIE